MISLVNSLKELASKVSSKAEKNWEYIGKAEDGNTPVLINVPDYSEILVVVYFGGVMMTSIFPPEVRNEILKTGKDITVVNPGYFNGSVYVHMSDTQISITQKVSYYTPYLYVYGKK